jgi:hypothetical protein
MEDFKIKIPITPEENIQTAFIELYTEGNLTVKAKYAWDGPSGPTIDTKNFMRVHLVHDALYQLMREKHIGIEKRDDADKLLRQHCIKDGMSSLRAWIVYKAVKWFGEKSALLSEKHTKLIYAP